MWSSGGQRIWRTEVRLTADVVQGNGIAMMLLAAVLRVEGTSRGSNEHREPRMMSGAPVVFTVETPVLIVPAPASKSNGCLDGETLERDLGVNARLA